MIVSNADVKNGIIEKFHNAGSYGLDTETTGLRWFGDHELFSLIIADEKESYYFNFYGGKDHLGSVAPSHYILPRTVLSQFVNVLNNPNSTWYAHNAKFDMGMLARDGLQIRGRVHCTEAMARLLDTQYYQYNLDICVKRMNTALKIEGEEKDDTVKKYVAKHKLFDYVTVPGKVKRFKDMHYELVPFDIMSKYGEQDGSVVRSLGMYQVNRMNKDLLPKTPGIKKVILNERALTPVLFRMEQKGMRLDVKYIDQASAMDNAYIDGQKREFKKITGEEYIDSGSLFKNIFDKMGIPYKTTEKGNASFNKDSLEGLDHELAQLILDIRSVSKRVNSYYSTFKHFAVEKDGISSVHASLMQGGTQTGRMSVRDPALQTIPKAKKDLDETDEFEDVDSEAVRRCFVPHSKDFCLFMPDYDQMEYRLMVDMAKEDDLIDKILEGLDVHTATAQLVGVTRKEAKTVNFMLLYGGGIQKLADSLGKTFGEARAIRLKYFEELKKVTRWKNQVIALTEVNGYSTSWLGRMCKIDRSHSYKAPNYVIQGGSADIVKKAMLSIDQLLKHTKSFMCLQVHDELIFNLHKDELDLAKHIVNIMESTYKPYRLPLTAGAGYSWESWADKIDGYPTIGNTTRNSIQKEGYVGVTKAP